MGCRDYKSLDFKNAAFIGEKKNRLYLEIKFGIEEDKIKVYIPSLKLKIRSLVLRTK